MEIVDAKVAYDRYAGRYDALLNENRVNAYMRKRTLAAHRSMFPDGSRLVEIGCGTGDEALELAAQGCEVVAIDPSHEMLVRARAKTAVHPAGGRVTFLQGRGREVGELLSSEANGSFDGGYSSFALSYEPDLRPLADAVARLVRPGGWFLPAIMNRVCAAEWFIAMGALHPGLAARRLASPMAHKVGSVATKVFPRTVSEVDRSFSSSFSRVQITAIPTVLPPPYMNRIVRRLPQLMDLLERVDPAVADLPLAHALGDHTLFTYRRRP